MDASIGEIQPQDLAVGRVHAGAETNGLGPQSQKHQCSPTGLEGIKVAIKNNQIKQTREILSGSSGKQSLSRQKSNSGGGKSKKHETAEDKFGPLKAKIQSKKRKQGDSSAHLKNLLTGPSPIENLVVGKQGGASLEKYAKFMVQPVVKMPKLEPERKSSAPVLGQQTPSATSSGEHLPPAFSGGEGILFSKSLKGFKIPKVVDERPKEEQLASQTSQPQVPPMTLNLKPQQAQYEPAAVTATSVPPVHVPPREYLKSPPRPRITSTGGLGGNRPPDLAPQISPRVPKSILKQTGKQSYAAQPPKLLAEMPAAPGSGSGANFRPPTRKGLLPIPPATGQGSWGPLRPPPPIPPPGLPPIPGPPGMFPQQFASFDSPAVFPPGMIDAVMGANPADSQAGIAMDYSSSASEPSPIKSPDGTIQSPDKEDSGMMIADDSAVIRSPADLNTSNNSDRSPELSIVTEPEGSDNV